MCTCADRADGKGWADPALETAAVQIPSCFIFTTQHSEPDALRSRPSVWDRLLLSPANRSRARWFPGLRCYPNNLVSLSVTSGWAGERVADLIAQVLWFPDGCSTVTRGGERELFPLRTFLYIFSLMTFPNLSPDAHTSQKKNINLHSLLSKATYTAHSKYKLYLQYVKLQKKNCYW